jgi:hypothetical protein
MTSGAVPLSLSLETLANRGTFECLKVSTKKLFGSPQNRKFGTFFVSAEAERGKTPGAPGPKRSYRGWRLYHGLGKFFRGSPLRTKFVVVLSANGNR